MDTDTEYSMVHIVVDEVIAYDGSGEVGFARQIADAFSGMVSNTVEMAKAAVIGVIYLLPAIAAVALIAIVANVVRKRFVGKRKNTSQPEDVPAEQ